MLRTMGFAALISLGLAGWASAQTVNDWVDRIDPADLQTGGIVLDLHHAGEVDGFMRFGWHADGEEIVLWDRTMWASREIFETYEAHVGLAGLDPRRVAIRFHQGETLYRFATEFQEGEALGYVLIERPGQDEARQNLSAELPQGSVLRASVFMLAATLPLEVGEQIELDWYAPMDNAVSRITLSAVEAVTIDTPDGPVDTIRLEQRGGQPPNDIFVIPGTRDVVRIDIVGQDLYFLARAGADPAVTD